MSVLVEFEFIEAWFERLTVNDRSKLICIQFAAIFLWGFKIPLYNLGLTEICTYFASCSAETGASARRISWSLWNKEIWFVNVKENSYWGKEPSAIENEWVSFLIKYLCPFQFLLIVLKVRLRCVNFVSLNLQTLLILIIIHILFC